MSGEKQEDVKRIVMLGLSGVGKSAIGNTLLGKEEFRSDCDEISEKRIMMKWHVGELPNSKRRIKVVDTPGIMDKRIKTQEIHKEIENALHTLSPGPHAILLVVSPESCMDKNQQIIPELQNIFLSDGFLQFTTIVMVRKKEIVDGNKEPMNIHTFIEEKAVDKFKVLYKTCKKRIVAVENVAPIEERNKYAHEIMAAIDGLGGGYFSLNYIENEKSKRCNIT